MCTADDGYKGGQSIVTRAAADCSFIELIGLMTGTQASMSTVQSGDPGAVFVDAARDVIASNIHSFFYK